MYSELSWLEMRGLFVSAVGDKEPNVGQCSDATLRKLTLATLRVRLRQLAQIEPRAL